MKTFPILLASAILATTCPIQAHGQAELDELLKAASTPTPAPTVAATPRPAAIQAPAATPQPRAVAPAAPRSTPAPVPRAEAKPDLSHAKFVQENDLAGLAGQKLANTYLVGTFKSNGEKSGSRATFTTRNVVPILGVIRGSTKILVRFAKTPDPKIFAAGYSCQWDQKSPLRVERVETGNDGVTVYATDLF